MAEHVAAATLADEARRTPVARVALVVLCGIVIALNVGKIPPALPGVRAELMLGLTAAGLMVAALNLIGSTMGGVVGMLIDRLGARRMVGAALLASAAGNAVGALAPTAAWLIVGRLIEGLAFILILSVAPVLLQRLAAPRDRGLVMGFWGSFLPIGSALAVALAPGLLAAGGWRLVWSVVGGLSLLAFAAYALREAPAPAPEGGGEAQRGDLLAVARTRPVLYAGLAFAGFSFTYIGVLSFLPTWVIETQGLGLEVGAATIIAYSLGNAAGNVSGGVLLRRGVSAARLIAVAAAVSGLLTLAIFLPGPPVWARLAAAIAFGTIGGWIPVSVFATAPRLAPEPRLAGAAMGLTVQLLNVGTLLGPIALTGAVELAGTWTIAPAVLIAGAALSLGAGLALTRHAKALAHG
jgi:predicted MFS family arabinose efflux permease